MQKHRDRRRLATRVLVALIIAVPACRTGAPQQSSSPCPDGAACLSPVAHLVRASMALRGTRPSLAELQRVDKDPGALADIIDDYLQTPEFGETIRDLHDEAWLTRANVRPDLFGFPALDPITQMDPTLGGWDVSRSIQEQPLRLIEDIVMSDRPYTDIVTADYVMTDGIAARVWGLSYDGDGTSWVRSHWDDGRPAAGVLSSSSVFNRFKSTPSNSQRGRANAVSKALICYDFLSTDIPLDASVDLADPDAVNDAVVNNEACAACHHDLDPLGSFLWGHMPFVLSGQIDAYPVHFYVSQIEGAWETGVGPFSGTGRAPAYFGQPGNRLDDLGAMIAADEGFSRCAARRFYAYLNQVPLDDVPEAAIDDLNTGFVASDYNARQLARSVVLRGDFAVSYADGGDADTLNGYRLVRPLQLRRLIFDLTGFRWQSRIPGFGDVDLLEDSFLGFGVLGGGIDSYYATVGSRTVNPTVALLQRTLAEEAAGYVVESDFATNAASRHLLQRVEESQTDETAVRTQLVDLHARLFGDLVAADSTDVDATYQLFADTLARTNDPRHAWKTTLAAMLQDARIIYY